jgi:DNA adenine methylase
LGGASEGPAKPFLKWPGGKRWLSTEIVRLLNGYRFRRYFEPFLGGGAVFFALRPENAILSDINHDLINTYIQVRYRPHALVSMLRQMPVDGEVYCNVRRDSPKRNMERAVRFLYLNRTAFGGMYRVNQSGLFNVPFGGGQRTPAPLWQEHLLIDASRNLKRALLLCADFEEVLAQAGAGDVVYCDPTYTVSHDNNGFIRYNERNFSWSDQERLAASCHRVAGRGATVVLSNAAHDKILELYRSCEVRTLNRLSVLCPDPEKRGPRKELLVIIRPRTKALK